MVPIQLRYCDFKVGSAPQSSAFGSRLKNQKGERENKISRFDKNKITVTLFKNSQ